MPTIYQPNFVCPYLLVCGKCSLDKTGNTICYAEDKSRVCEDIEKLLAKDGEQE